MMEVYQDDNSNSIIQHTNAINLNDSVSSTCTKAGPLTACCFVDDNKTVAIVLTEKAYNGGCTVNQIGSNADVNVHVDSSTDDHALSAPAVTIFGRGETPVADWFSRCDGLEFGGPINEDLLSMDYSVPININQGETNSIHLDPMESIYYQEMQLPSNSSMAMPAYKESDLGQHGLLQANVQPQYVDCLLYTSPSPRD